MNKNDPVISVRLTKNMKDKIDRIVKDGVFINQSDFVRTAIRKQLNEISTWRKIE